MNEAWISLLKTVINPMTKKTLFEEDRFINVKMEEDILYFQYKRDGISVSDKKAIELEVMNLFKGILPMEQLRVTTVSDRSTVIAQTLSGDKDSDHHTHDHKHNHDHHIAPKDTAQIKVGHGTPGNKRPVPGVKKIIAVGSGKGGVGKSTFSVNLAKSLQLLGYKVGLIDADIYGPSIPKLLGSEGKKPFTNNEKKILPLEAFDLKFMSFGLFIDANAPVIWRGPMLGGVLNQFLFDVDWQGTDYLIIDLPPGTGDIQLSMIQNTHVDGSIIICTPQDLALIDAVKGLEMFRKLNVPVLGMVENMSSFICDKCDKEHFIFGHHGVKKESEKLQVPFLGSIPLEMSLRVSADEGNLYMSQEKFKKTKTWASYIGIASGISKHLPV